MYTHVLGCQSIPEPVGSAGGWVRRPTIITQMLCVFPVRVRFDLETCNTGDPYDYYSSCSKQPLKVFFVLHTRLGPKNSCPIPPLTVLRVLRLGFLSVLDLISGPPTPLTSGIRRPPQSWSQVLPPRTSSTTMTLRGRLAQLFSPPVFRLPFRLQRFHDCSLRSFLCWLWHQ